MLLKFSRQQRRKRKQSSNSCFLFERLSLRFSASLSTTPLWTVSPEEKLRLCSSRLLNLCERLVSCSSSIDVYQFPPSPLLLQSQAEFGLVDWWNITQTDPQDDEVPTPSRSL